MKKAFTMAELIIALGIISIVVASGLAFSKRNTDRAFNMYYYKSYKGLYDVISENSGSVPSGPLSCVAIGKDASGNDIENETEIDKAQKWRYYFNVASCGDNAAGHQVITTTENISYEVQDGSDILVTIPASNGSTTQYRVRIHDRGLIPYNVEGGVTIQTRPDLIAFYLDDGLVGRTVDGTYNSVTVIPAQTAFCRILGNSVESMGINYNCQEIGSVEEDSVVAFKQP